MQALRWEVKYEDRDGEDEGEVSLETKYNERALLGTTYHIHLNSCLW